MTLRAACLCGIARDEAADDVREWVCYHLGLGFSHVALYDNGSREPLREVLAPLVARGVVSVTDIPLRDAPQLSAYFHALRLWRGQTFWLAFLDIDEFLVPLSGPGPTDAVPPLSRLLRPYERFGGLVLHWMMMGSAGHLRRPPGGTLANYGEALGLDGHVKSIVRPELVTRPLSPHHFAYREGAFAVNEDGFPVAGPCSYPTARHLRVNHYYYKSQQDFEAKIARGLATPVPGGARTLDNFYAGCIRPGVRDAAVVPWLGPGAEWARQAGWGYPAEDEGSGGDAAAPSAAPRLSHSREMQALRQLWQQIEELCRRGVPESELLALRQRLWRQLCALYTSRGVDETARAAVAYWREQTQPKATAGGGESGEAVRI